MQGNAVCIKKYNITDVCLPSKKWSELAGYRIRKHLLTSIAELHTLRKPVSLTACLTEENPFTPLPANVIMTVSANGCINRNYMHHKGGGNMEVIAMTEKEQMQKNVEEFARLQNYMVLAEKDSASYKAMKGRYIELKVILTASGINLTELDIIKE